MTGRRLVVWGLVWWATLITLIAVGRSEQRTETALLATRDSLRVVRVAVDSLRRAYAVQRPAADRWRTRWDTLTLRGDTLRVRDTLYVPYEVVVIADSTIKSCTRALNTCDALADSLSRQVRLTAREGVLAARRAWWAAGPTYDGGWGAFVERDLGRLRLGGSVTPNRAQVWGGVRW